MFAFLSLILISLAERNRMQQLTDFKPLRRVVLPGLGDLACSGLIVLVGPNASGKSQLLQDIYRRLAGEPRRLVVAQIIEIDKPPFEPFMKCLEDEGYFTTVADDLGNKQWRPQTMYLGMGQPINQIQPNQAESWYGSFSPQATDATLRQSEFLNYFGRLLVTALFLERRLTSLNAIGVIDFNTQAPQHDLHALYLDDQARERLQEEIQRSFGRVVWPDMSRGNQMSLKVSEVGIPPTAEDRHSHKKMSAYRSIETEGDGIKSYVATCISLLLGRRPVCVIDEPEMCLHPPQAYNLGRFIGRFGASPETATFVATHSSHLLRGIIQAAQQVQVVRLIRSKSFCAYRVPDAELARALSRPTLKAEAVLDGIFAQAVIVVEADGDRVVYQAVWETLQSEFRIDIHFSTVGGTGGIADTCRLYRTLHIPIAIIADLDMFVDRDKLINTLKALIDDTAVCERLEHECNDIAKSVRNVPPGLSPLDVDKQLSALGVSNLDWNANDDVELKRRLNRIANSIDRMRRLKGGGLSSYPEPLRRRFEEALAELRRFGLFLVPVGELEQWLGNYDVPESKSNKGAWANSAAMKIQQLGKQSDDVWAFVDGVGRYLVIQPTNGARPAFSPKDI